MLEQGKLTGIDQLLTFEELSSWPYQEGLKGMPEQIKKIDGKRVMMVGFMLPIDKVENMKEFLLVESLWACCYGQPPDINGIVRVVMTGDNLADYEINPVRMIGTFEVEEYKEEGWVVDIYQLHIDEYEVIK